jgi:hypothetical protein
LVSRLWRVFGVDQSQNILTENAFNHAGGAA